MKIMIKSAVLTFLVTAVIVLTSLFSFGADSCSTHNFIDGRCTACDAYYVETGKTVKVILEEKGLRLTGIAWTIPSGSVISIEDKGSEGILSDTTYYVIINGLKAGESEVYAYSMGSRIQTSIVYVDCKNHSYSEYVSDNNASCTDGTKSAKCKLCDKIDTVTDVGSAVHDVKNYTSNGDATCTKDGTKTGVCSKCSTSVTVTDVNSKIPHDYKNYVSDGNATCDKDGTKTGICTVCSDKDIVADEGSATGHSFGEYVSDNNAKCTEDGTMSAVCSKCGGKDTKTDLYSRYGHSLGDWIITAEMSCLEDGARERYCTRCNLKESEVIVKSGHSLVYQQAKDPTCKEEGRTSGWYCKNSYCKTEFPASTIIPKTEHEINESVYHATLIENGNYMETCKNCDEIFAVETIYRPKTVELQQISYNYDGQAKMPAVVVIDADDKPLTEGEDYKIIYDEGRRTPGKYYVKVNFRGRYQGSKILSFVIKPSKSDTFEATQTTNTITLRWSKVIGATGYRLYVYNTKTGKYKTLKTTQGTTTTIKELKAGTTYKYAVKAYTKTDDGETIWAETSAKLTTATKPATLKVKLTAGSKKVDLSWNKVTGATGYQIYMKAPGGSYKKIKVTTALKYTVKNLQKGKTYNFRVRAYSKVDGKYIYGDYKTYSVTVK